MAQNDGKLILVGHVSGGFGVRGEVKITAYTADPLALTSYGPLLRADGYHAATALLALAERPDAIFCYSDLLATGAMRAVFDAGLRVPEDVAIIGIDDIEEGRYSRPSLSTVSLDTPFIAHHAVARIAARIAEPESPAVEVVAPHTLIVRESTEGVRT